MWNRKENYFRKDNCRFPFLFQSVPLVSMGIAVARRARSVCTAVGPATTSLACVTACLASQEPSAMKVRYSLGETPGDEQAPVVCPQAPRDLSAATSSRCLQGPRFAASADMTLSFGRVGLPLQQNLFILWAVLHFSFNCKQPPMKKSIWGRILPSCTKSYEINFLEMCWCLLVCDALMRACGLMCL